MKEYTHTGYIVGADTRTPKDYRKKVNLRATKTMWVTKSGMRFRRDKREFWNGSSFGDWPLYQLTDIKDNMGDI